MLFVLNGIFVFVQVQNVLLLFCFLIQNKYLLSNLYICNISYKEHSKLN